MSSSIRSNATLAGMAISSGTVYKKRAGGDNITLTCSPATLAYSDDYDAYGAVNYSSSIIVPQVTLVGATRFYQPHAVKFLTGQQITGQISGVSGSGLSITSRLWGTEGPPDSDSISDPGLFKSYLTSLSLGKVYFHTPADKAASTFSFYTVDNASLVVTCDLVFALPAESRFEGGLPNFKAKSRTIESVRPTMASSQQVYSGLVALYPNSTYPSDIAYNGNPNNPNSSNGQDWRKVGIDVPPPFSQAGQGCFAQIVSGTRDLYRHALNGRPDHWTYSCDSALDNDYPYPYSVGTGSSHIFDLPGTGYCYDSPSQPLSCSTGDNGGSDWYSSIASDKMKTWLMFKPPSAQGQPTTWIPIAKYEWSWNGAANKSSGQWTLTSGTGQVTSGPTENKKHPEWNNYTTGPSPFIGVP